MSALDPQPADAKDARRVGSDDIACQQDDVTEGRPTYVDFYAPDNRREWQPHAVRLSVWLIAGAISLLANAELFMLLAHRDAGETNAGPVDPAVVMIDLPAVETAAAELTRADVKPDAKPDAEPEAQAATQADGVHEAPQTATPESPKPPEAVAQPDDAALAEAPLPTPAPDAWNVAPLPVPRPRSLARTDVGRRAVEPPSARRIVRAAAVARPADLSAPRREPHLAAGSVYAGATSAADWKSQVVAALNRAKHYPNGSEAVGSPTLRMVVAASGDVARVAIVASSGSSALDTAAIDTVRRTSPLPPPPGGTTGLTFRMNFHLRSP